ncbi:Acg family FMN-binding oxidoreductase [Actinokineospora sp. NPDC004072]
MTAAQPDRGTVRAVLALAGRAPSVHNTQPWRWVAGAESVHLMADWDRWLRATDPDGRDLLVSCGAALHHLRTAFAGLGFAARVHRLPNPAEPAHLAAVEPRAATATDEQVALVAAIGRRRTDRRRFSSRPVPASHLDFFAATAAEQGALAVPIAGVRARRGLTTAFTSAAARQECLDGYRTELGLWSGRARTGSDGVPRTAAPNAPMTHNGVVMRAFSAGSLTTTGQEQEVDAGALLVLATAGDDPLSRLRAGEAASAVLLAATSLGLATCPLSQPLELPETRAAIRVGALDGAGVPQLILRLGWAPADAAPLPATPRRPVEDLLSRLPGTGPQAL